MAKFGFLLILILFGLLMFAAGSLAPASFRESAQSMITRGKDELAALTGFASREANSASKPAPASAAPASAAAKADPIPAENLIIPSPLPDKGQYGLQLGQFADAAQAKELSGRGNALKLPMILLDTIDQSGKRWAVVAAGPYVSPDEARAARTPVARELGFTEPMPMILIPASK